MKRFKAKKAKRPLAGILSVLLLAVVLISFIIGLNRIQVSNEAEQAKLLERSVTRSITACYA